MPHAARTHRLCLAIAMAAAPAASAQEGTVAAWSRGLDLALPPHDLRFRQPESEPPPVAVSAQGVDNGKRFRLPLLGVEARKAGYELPPPFGIGGVYTYVERDVEIHDIRVGIDGAALRNASDFINLGSRSHVNVALGRFDVFLFPFLDVYALLGYVKNDTTTTGDVTVESPGPGPGTISFPLHARTHLDGFVGGFGATLAGGYKEAFAALDVNWTQTDIGFDDEFKAVIAALRVGWNGKVQGTPVRLWTGAVYWDTESTASSTVQVEGVGPVSFEADQAPANPWNMIIGGHVTIEGNFDLFLELGSNFDDMKSVTLGLTYRF